MGKYRFEHWCGGSSHASHVVVKQGSSTISPAIIDALYEEALCLAEAARAEFDMTSDVGDAIHPLTDMGELVAGIDERATARIVLSCEALRTTTRMMHAMAWLLNHRAYFRGELTAFQLRRFGRLPPAQETLPAADRALLKQAAREVIERSCALYERLARLDAAFHRSFEMQPPAIERLRSRIDRAFATS